MKILFINTYLNQGGASKATYRLHHALKKNPELDVKFFVQKSFTTEQDIFSPKSKVSNLISDLRAFISTLPFRLFFKPKGMFSQAWLSNRRLRKTVQAFQPDVIHVNWVGDGVLSFRDLQAFGKPLVWTMHDSWLMTGGCHVPASCQRYDQNCGQCPLLSSSFKLDPSWWHWRAKADFFKTTQSQIVAPSKWLFSKASQSSLLKDQKVQHIPNGVNTEVFKPVDMTLARQILNIPLNKKVIAIAGVGLSNDSNKGFDLFEGAVNILSPEMKDQILLLVIGADQKADEASFCGVAARFVGNLFDDISIGLHLSASDVVCVPSRSENFPNMILESLACGTPVVGFSVGGIPDILQHKKNGYLATPFWVEDLKTGLEFFLLNKVSKPEICKTVDSFSIEHCAERYLELYRRMLAGDKV